MDSQAAKMRHLTRICKL